MYKTKTSFADKAFVVCNTIFMILFVIITLYPVLNTVAISFNDGIDAVGEAAQLGPLSAVQFHIGLLTCSYSSPAQF